MVSSSRHQTNGIAVGVEHSFQELLKTTRTETEQRPHNCLCKTLTRFRQSRKPDSGMQSRSQAGASRPRRNPAGQTVCQRGSAGGKARTRDQRPATGGSVTSARHARLGLYKLGEQARPSNNALPKSNRNAQAADSLERQPTTQICG